MKLSTGATLVKAIHWLPCKDSDKTGIGFKNHEYVYLCDFGGDIGLVAGGLPDPNLTVDDVNMIMDLADENRIQSGVEAVIISHYDL